MRDTWRDIEIEQVVHEEITRDFARGCKQVDAIVEEDAVRGTGGWNDLTQIFRERERQHRIPRA